jgi:hypothetical protein
MKKITLVLASVALFIASCGTSDVKVVTTKDTTAVKAAVVAPVTVVVPVKTDSAAAKSVVITK